MGFETVAIARGAGKEAYRKMLSGAARFRMVLNTRWRRTCRFITRPAQSHEGLSPGDGNFLPDQGA
ncbi:hypothetical protein [Streptomyces sp. NPDC048473]|uniref:hypothetical protein n=1 Tax=unclassified Streptomyces TaxID=2593676 RepID=UPI0037199830